MNTCSHCYAILIQMDQPGFYRCQNCRAVFQEMEGEHGVLLVEVSAYSGTTIERIEDE